MFRQLARMTQAQLTHEEVVQKMVDYHFGRLPPNINKAIESHIRTCPRCKAEGLGGAVSARQSSGRRLRGVRGGKPLIGKRGWRIILGIAVLVACQIVLVQITRGQGQSLATVLDQFHAPGVSSAMGLSTSSLSPTYVMPPGTADSTAMALSMNGADMILSQSTAQNATQTSPHIAVSLWSVKNGDQISSLPWTSADAPSTMAWDASGNLVAAASASQLVIWSPSSHLAVANFALPSTPGAVIYDVSQKTVVSAPDPSALFGTGLQAWGADGALNPAPGGAAGPTSVTAPWTPVVGLWSSAGVHIFGDGQGGAQVGISGSDATLGDAVLDWSPDGRYLLWASFALPVSGSNVSKGATAPDSIIRSLTTQVAKASDKGADNPGANDALLWFSPDGSRVAVCDRATPNANVTIYDVASGDPAATLAFSCANLLSHAGQWAADGSRFYLLPVSDPIQIYLIPSNL